MKTVTNKKINKAEANFAKWLISEKFEFTVEKQKDEKYYFRISIYKKNGYEIFSAMRISFESRSKVYVRDGGLCDTWNLRTCKRLLLRTRSYAEV